MTDLKRAWQEFCNDLKNEQPFKFVYKKMFRILGWLENILEKL